MPEVKKYRVRYRKVVAWAVGESQADAQERRERGENPPTHDRWPDDYSGRVSSVVPYDSETDAGGMPEVTLDLTKEERVRLASRKAKIVDGETLWTTFEDRHGANAHALDLLYKEGGEVAEARCAALTAMGDVHDRGFDRDAIRLTALLANNVAHTGTGLYAVKAAPAHNNDTQSGPPAGPPAGQVITLTVGGLGTLDAWKGGYVTNATRVETRAIVSHTDMTVTLEGNLVNWLDTDDLDIFDAWAAVQTAFDQLWTDQGGVDFSAEQVISLYDGTYTEDVDLNAGLDPMMRWKLRIQAAEGEDAVIVTNVGLAADTFDQNGVDSTEYEGFTIMTVLGGQYAVESFARSVVINNCVIDGNGVGDSRGLDSGNGSLIRDCTFKDITRVHTGAHARYERCLFENVTDYVVRCTVDETTFEACVFDGCDKCLYYYGNTNDPTPESGPNVRNCTFYSCAEPFYAGGANAGSRELRLRARNCIFLDNGIVFYSDEGIGRVQSDDNCFDGNTEVANIDSTSYTTLAAWQALADEDGRYNDLSSIEEDPLLTDPTNHDFTLQAASPCRRAGGGSGIESGQAGVDFDKHHPDMGALSGEESQSAVVWPSTLPQTVDQPQYLEGMIDVVERSEMDTGPAKTRRRFTSGIQQFSARMTITIAQAATFTTFYETSTQGGALPFQWTHPRTGVTVLMRFLSPPPLTPRGPQYFVATLSLEILP